MSRREIRCRDGTRWRVSGPSRSSMARLDIVFESIDEPGLLLRGEAVASDLAELTDEQLCFLLEEVRAAS